jgi:predicted acylesterase/phospholipase RssA
MSDTTPDRLGLALSGGGFRASFFHLGVLLQLARHGVLRQVEVISTVSGGSIVGAQLYLHLRQLLRVKPDTDITDSDYVSLVLRMREELSAVTRRNLRTRAFASVWAVTKMFWPYYSRTERIAELYDKLLFRPLVPDASGPLELRNLAIVPHGSKTFDPATQNRDRLAKVPALLLNATALNSGNNWRFSTVTMGEPTNLTPAAQELDKGPRLVRPPTYESLPSRRAGFKLGHAVAASTCVPGLFFPVPVPRMYEQLTVQLVDGGVHDNQGIQGLLDEPQFECRRMIVSDGSGQMEWQPYPATDLIHAIGRSNAILMKRMREEQLGLLPRSEDAIFVHLRQGLKIEERFPRLAGSHAQAPQVPSPGDTILHGDVSFQADVQRHLAHIRTDLDSFTDVEGTSLGLLGYAMTGARLGKFAASDPIAEDETWWLLRARPLVVAPDKRYLRQLAAARSRWLRPVLLVTPVARVLAPLVFLAALVAAVKFIDPVADIAQSVADGLESAWSWQAHLSPVRVLVVALGIAVLLLLGRAAERRRLFRLWWWATTFAVNVVRTVPLLLLCATSNIYLLTIDRWIVRRGRIPEGPPVDQ